MQGPIEAHTNLYRRLKNHGVKINNVIDVGCYKGDWTARFKLIYPGAKYYLIDPNDKFKEKLKVLGTFYQEVVGEKLEEREFNFSQNDLADTGNSLYDENSNAKFKKQKVMVRPLQDIVPKQSYEVIKMDVQGAELEIIEGSLDLFKQTKFVQLECPVHPNNVGARETLGAVHSTQLWVLVKCMYIIYIDALAVNCSLHSSVCRFISIKDTVIPNHRS